MASPDDHDSFRAASRRRILDDMLGQAAARGSGDWRVLVVDAVTVRVVSGCCGMSDLTGAGVSLVENLDVGREPQRHLEAVYFVSPSLASVEKICADFAGKTPEARPYAGAHVFFSSPVPPAHLALVKKCRGLVASLASLAELNLEYECKDSRSFVTNQPDALEHFFAAGPPGAGPAASGASSTQKHPEFARAADVCATRVATLLASLGEFAPLIRYRSVGPDGVPGGSPAAAVAQRVYRQMLALAEKQREKNAREKKSAEPLILEQRGCDVLILDRSVDPLAALARHWTYEALVRDLLPVTDAGLYAYAIETNAGRKQKEAVLNEQDPLWVELRDAHFASALNALAERAAAFGAAGAKSRVDASSTTGSMRRVVENLPRFVEAQAKLSVHTSVAASINAALEERGLSEIGRVEEEIIFGEATSKDIVALLGSRREGGGGGGGASSRGVRPADALRLLLLYAASHPEKFDDAERARWMKLTGLTRGDLAKVANLARLGVRVEKPGKASSGSSASAAMASAMTFRTTKAKRPAVHARRSEWDLHRFLPTAHHLALALDRGTLPEAEYPTLGGGGGAGDGGSGAGGSLSGNPFESRENSNTNAREPGSGPPGPGSGVPGSPARGPGGGGGGVTTHASAPPKTPGKTPGKSARTKGGGWAKRSLGGDAEFGFDAANAARESDASGASLDELGRATTNAAGHHHHHRHARTQSAVPAVANRRLVVFVVGGVSFGETREAAELAAATQREVIFGGTSAHAPERFVEMLARLGNGGGGVVPALQRNDADVELDDIVIED